MSLSIIYLTNYVGPRARALRGITTDSAAGRKKMEDVSRALKAAGARMFVYSFGWTTKRAWAYYPATSEPIREGLLCEYASLLRVPLVSVLSNALSMAAHIGRRVALEKKAGATCRLLIYNMTPQMVAVALYARLVLRIPVFLELEDGNHLVPTLGPARRAAFYLLQAVLRPLISGAVLVTSSLREGYDHVPTIVCRGIAVPELASIVPRSWDEAIKSPERSMLTVFFSGTLDDIRGAELLERALLLADGDPQFPAHRMRVVITGRGSRERVLLEACRRVTRVHAEFAGFVDETTYVALLREAHAAMALQRPDLEFSRACFPSKIVEYMSAGLLVLTTVVADVAAFGGDGVVLIDPATPERLTSIWKELLQNPAPYAAVAVRGRTLVAEQCSLERVGADLVELIA